jgi:hypothetical protein
MKENEVFLLKFCPTFSKVGRGSGENPHGFKCFQVYILMGFETLVDI